MLFEFLICFIAGIGAGLGTGFAGMSLCGSNKSYAYNFS